jgi:alanine racemase
VTEPLLGAPRALPPASGTTVTLSSAALRGNIRVAHDATATPDLRTDPLAADAWGHGHEWVRDILSEHPVSALPSGAHLYGLPGAGDDTVPVMRLSGRVLSTKDLRRGEGVSYGYLHRAEEDTRIALVTGGYAQGVVRALGSRVAVTIDGVAHRIVGRVAMDVCVVDIGGHAVARGTEAVYFGDPRAGEPSLATWTTATGLSAAELVAAVGLRARRVHR